MRLIIYLATVVIVTAMAIDDTPARVFERASIPTLAPAVPARPKTPTSQGCFSSVGELVDPKNYIDTSVTIGYCRDAVCKNSTVFAAKAESCYCGSKYPPKKSQVDDSKCNYSCPSYLQEACGGIDGGSFYSVFNTGIEVDVPYADDVSSTSGNKPSSTASIETVTEEPTGKANVGGIAAGVVVGVLAIAGIGGGFWFYMRRKRNQEIEDEHRRNAAVSGFMGHKPGSSGAISITDARLDPVMAQRRLSDGSIADNQDYSRKILRVTNA